MSHAVQTSPHMRHLIRHWYWLVPLKVQSLWEHSPSDSEGPLSSSDSWCSGGSSSLWICGGGGASSLGHCFVFQD